jgi:chromosome segregation ATPase
MTPQAWLGVASVIVAIGTFLLGRMSKRWTAQGAADADAASLKKIADSLQAEVTRHGQQLATFDAEVKSLRGNLDERYNSQRAAWARVDDLATRVAQIETRCEEREKYGREQTGRHYIGDPSRGRGEGGGAVGDGT